MPKDVLIRQLSDDDAEWITSSLPPGMSQEAYLRQIISKARIEANQLPAPRRRGKSAFTFIDLFAGIGGFYFGMASNGGKCVFTNEWDRWAAATYRAWTRNNHVSQVDVRSLNFELDIPDHDILCGGFPCQPFSIAGVSKKLSLGRAHGFEDEKQGNLFFAICSVAEAKRPKVMVLENVKNLQSHDKGNTWKVICESLEKLDYTMKFKVIDAQAWVPQHRERIFMVCFDRNAFTADEIESFAFPSSPKAQPMLESILELRPDKKYMLSDSLWAYLQAYAAKHAAAGNGFGYGLVGPKDIARTMSARYYKDGSEILIKQRGWRNPRRLTPREAAQLMGFTAKFSELAGHGEEFPQVVSDTQAYKQFGNSVCPLVVEAIGREVLKVLKRRTRRIGTR